MIYSNCTNCTNTAVTKEGYPLTKRIIIGFVTLLGVAALSISLRRFRRRQLKPCD